MSQHTYDVFLSYRGEDTRLSFIDHLYSALAQAGIHTFKDDDEIERGESIAAKLQKAVKESKISIIVFSRHYASSRWCLDELLTIMERRKTCGHSVVPVYYDVDPSQVRKQTGSFAEAFARHEKQFEKEMDKVEWWRAALREVTDLGGMVFEMRHESQFVQNIVKVVLNKLNRTVLNVDRYLVGLDSRVRDINLWVQDGSNDIGIVMIYGISGIGKTTIAKTVYNLNYDRFQGSSFLANVRETTEQPKGLVRLQRQLLSNILKAKASKIYNVDEGIIKIKDTICHRKVFIVLDDVDQLDQLNALIGMREWFYPGSKIIITTRHERLLRSLEVCEKFKVDQMDDDESLELFSWHAFGQGHPTEVYMEFSRTLVWHCGGLPLALKLLGYSLYDKSIHEWKSVLHKLKSNPGKMLRELSGLGNHKDPYTALKEKIVTNLDQAKGAQQPGEAAKDNTDNQQKGDQNPTSTTKTVGKNGKQGPQGSDPPKEEYIHVRARRGQATNSHSLAERVRREKISERMKLLQDLVPGCSKVTGKAVMLDEIINYVQSLQRQVETELRIQIEPNDVNYETHQRGDGWSQKVKLVWMFVIINFALEIPSAVFDQLSSVHKPIYALISMLLSFIAMLLSIIEIIYKGREEGVVWRRMGIIPWFYYPLSNLRFGTLVDIVGLACAIPQFIFAAITYGLACRNVANPIKISVWPIIFAFGLLCSKLSENPNRSNPTSKQDS